MTDSTTEVAQLFESGAHRTESVPAGEIAALG